MCRPSTRARTGAFEGASERRQIAERGERIAVILAECPDQRGYGLFQHRARELFRFDGRNFVLQLDVFVAASEAIRQMLVTDAKKMGSDFSANWQTTTSMVCPTDFQI